MLIVLATSPRVAPGLLSWPAWEALRSAAVVLAPPGHPQLPALDAAGIGYRLVEGADEADLAWVLFSVADEAAGQVRRPAQYPHLLEEPYEALEALESGDEQAFREELGDVLLQVVFHARIAAERHDGTGYTIDDVADGIVDKLVRRHPHVFADVAVSGADEVKRNWDAIKQDEKRTRAERQGKAGDGQAASSVLDGVPFGQPALALAAQLQRRAERAGMPSELARLDSDGGAGEPEGSGEDIGRQLFRLVAKARRVGRDPEMELRAAARRYRELVRDWERS